MDLEWLGNGGAILCVFNMSSLKLKELYLICLSNENELHMDGVFYEKEMVPEENRNQINVSRPILFLHQPKSSVRWPFYVSKHIKLIFDTKMAFVPFFVKLVLAF